MEKYFNVIEQTLDLLDIIDEGLTHIHKQLTELRLEESLILLEDTTEALESIQSALEPVLSELEDTSAIEEKQCKMMKSFNVLVKEYERSNIGNALDTIELSLEPCFKLWKHELEKNLRPFIVS